MDVHRLLNPFFVPSGSAESDQKKWPSCYPPNGNPRAETINGSLVKRDYLPLKPFTLEDYTTYGASDTRVKELVYEDNRREPGYGLSRNVIHRVAKKESDLYFSFASCNLCYKTGMRNFGDSEITPYPTRVSSSHPLLPQVGLCGCIICNECIQQLIDHPRNRNKWFVHCPYCGNANCFSKHYTIWAVSEKVFKMEKITQEMETHALNTWREISSNGVDGNHE
jgi:hypothetical protein